MAVLISADSQATDTGGNYAFNDTGAYSHLAQSIAPTTSYTVYSIQLSLLKSNSPTGTLQVKIRVDSGGSPGASITNGESATVDASTLGTSTGFIEFTFATPPSLTAETTYHIELTHAGGTFDGTNTVGWSRPGSDAYASGTMELQTNGGGWTDVAAEDFAWKIYKPDPVVTVNGSFAFL